MTKTLNVYINKRPKNKIAQGSKVAARQIHIEASNSFFLIFVLVLKLIILLSENTTKRLEMSIEFTSRLEGISPINKQK